jgi:hypothetical protein
MFSSPTSTELSAPLFERPKRAQKAAGLVLAVPLSAAFRIAIAILDLSFYHSLR